jgi:hypothetical protein
MKMPIECRKLSVSIHVARAKTHLHLRHLPVCISKRSATSQRLINHIILTTALPRISTSTFGATAHNKLPNSKIKIAKSKTVFARAMVRT